MILLQRNALLAQPFQVLLIAIFLLTRAADPQAPDPPVPVRVTSVTLTPAALEFGSQPVGKSSRAMTSTLSNLGKTPVSVSDVTASGIDFSQTTTCSGTLLPGATCQISVTFTPAIDGPRMGTVIVSDSDPASPHMLVLKGSGMQ